MRCKMSDWHNLQSSSLIMDNPFSSSSPYHAIKYVVKKNKKGSDKWQTSKAKGQKVLTCKIKESDKIYCKWKSIWFSCYFNFWVKFRNKYPSTASILMKILHFRIIGVWNIEFWTSQMGVLNFQILVFRFQMRLSIHMNLQGKKNAGGFKLSIVL